MPIISISFKTTATDKVRIITVSTGQRTVSLSAHLVGVGACDTDGVEQILQAVWDRPQVESHLPRYQRVCVVKQVDVAPGQGTMFLQENADDDK